SRGPSRAASCGRDGPGVRDAQRVNRLHSSPMPHAVRIHTTGGTEVTQLAPIDLPEPRPGEARLRQQSVSLNFIDTYHRSGLYPLPLPHGLGMEAAGVVEAIGEDVGDLRPGDRVAYASGPPGAYADVRCLPAERLVPLPANVDDQTAAA